MNASSVLGVVATIFGIAGLLGGCLAYLNTQRIKATITILQEENAALTGRGNRLEKELDTATARIELLEQEAEVLRRVATGQAAAEIIGEHLDRTHAESMEAHGRTLSAVEAWR